MVKQISFFSLALLLFFPRIDVMAASEDTYRIALVGASNGKAWQIDRLADRVDLPGKYRFEYLGANSFDKSPLVQALTKRTEKPRAVMIKECATYFPGKLSEYQRLEMEWVKSLREAGILPILVTTPPLAEPTGIVQRTKDFVKGLVGKPTWQASVLEFNDWLRAYAKRENIPVFDVEAVLRREDQSRWLRDEFDEGDGLHLNRAAYQHMDRAFIKFLAERARAGS